MSNILIINKEITDISTHITKLQKERDDLKSELQKYKESIETNKKSESDFLKSEETIKDLTKEKQKTISDLNKQIELNKKLKEENGELNKKISELLSDRQLKEHLSESGNLGTPKSGATERRPKSSTTKGTPESGAIDLTKINRQCLLQKLNGINVATLQLQQRKKINEFIEQIQENTNEQITLGDDLISKKIRTFYKNCIKEPGWKGGELSSDTEDYINDESNTSEFIDNEKIIQQNFLRNIKSESFEPDITDFSDDETQKQHEEYYKLSNI